ncbi:class I SAM-dependent methyltransferase [Falsibacillus albus]|uniref:Class I SAM-dependent methyltransferase n=1 Tax=Falsibacillus albus TaxID=2478915 RepID=A0A3L7JZJ7_9BACI|nr:class I SAM-dependent methyltransferase [Falsibacillus albus]RLQ96203.1 class I SAM-dependent methyltransferase [Falsibacillus albus]
MDQFKTILKKSYDQKTLERNEQHLQSWKINEMNKFIEKTPPKGTLTLLDLGSGPGHQADYFKNNGFEVTCIDLSTSMIETCKQKGLNAIEMDFSDLEFPSSHFDLVWSMNSLLHIPKAELPITLKNIQSVLKPGGLFYMGVYGGAESEGIWEDDTYEPKRFFSFYRHKDIQMAVSAFFKVEDFRVLEMGEGQPDYQALLLSNSYKK